MVYRVCVEKKPGLAPECASLLSDCRSFLDLKGLTLHPAEGRFTIFIEYFGNILALLFLNVGVKVDQVTVREQRSEDLSDTALAATHEAY